MIAAAAAAARTAGLVSNPRRVSMRRFNSARQLPAVVTAFGEDIPTAEAIHLRFNARGVRRLSWQDIVDGALRDDPTMWLSAVTRTPAVEDQLSEDAIRFALRHVQRTLDGAVPNHDEYERVRVRLIAQDRRKHGSLSILADVLPTGNQIYVACGRDWSRALSCAGLEAADRRESVGVANRRPSVAGPSRGSIWALDAALGCALYAAMNDAWPSHEALIRWGRHAGLSFQWPGVTDGLMTVAGALMRAHGLEPPAAERPVGRGSVRRLIRVPAAAFPDAPAPQRKQSAASGTVNDAAHIEHAELCVLALRMWLAELAPGDSQGLRSYRTRRRGTSWPTQAAMDRHGGFGALRDLARAANAASRRSSGAPMTDFDRARLKELLAGRRPGHRPGRGPADRDPPRIDVAAAFEHVRTVEVLEVELNSAELRGKPSAT